MPILENGFCNACGYTKAEWEAEAVPEADRSQCTDENGNYERPHDFTWNGCNVCDGDHWIVNDVDESGPWRVCPECNAPGNIAIPFSFEPSRAQ